VSNAVICKALKINKLEKICQVYKMENEKLRGNKNVKKIKNVKFVKI
jgi:hypothetical protein